MSIATSSVLGYHGCDQRVADEIIRKITPFRHSTNSYDWLGDGAYFWLGSYHRALDWANFKQSRGEITTPAVLCAEISLGHCLNLTDFGVSRELSTSYDDLAVQFASIGTALPQNGGPRPFGIPLFRNLDCAVIQFLHHQRAQRGEQPYDTVIGAFEEGAPAFAGASIRERSHIQLAVRTPACILTVFQLP